MNKKHTQVFADVCFVIQVICTILFGGGQFLRMLTTSQGVSMTWFIFWEAFLVLNLILAVRAHQTQPSCVTLQTICSYALWTVMVTADLAVMLWKGNGVWDVNDTLTTVLGGAGVTLTLCIAYHKKLGIGDPIAKGWLAVSFKAIPQLIMAYKICLEGGAGLAGLTVIMGHMTVLTRLGQLYASLREAGWDRNRIGSALSEVANETSWMLVTIAWLIY